MKLTTTRVNTLLGPMIVIADEKALYLLEFVDRKNLEGEIQKLQENLRTSLIEGSTAISELIQRELDQYFKGALGHFQTPIQVIGSSFQKDVWGSLQDISIGMTRSYSDVARSIRQPLSFRRVARTIGQNQLAIIIPCHRVIQADGKLGGYSGGFERKKWLLNHENYIEKLFDI